MSWLAGSWVGVLHAAVKIVLMYVVALIALRLGERRTLSQWTIIDFATAVAVGAIIGRTALAADQAFTTGAVALLVLVAVHRVASRLRLHPLLNKLFDHRVRVLVLDGAVRREELRRCGLTDNDLFTHLRQRGVLSLADVHLVLYETKGSISVVPADVTGPRELVESGLAGAVNVPEDLRPG